MARVLRRLFVALPIPEEWAIDLRAYVEEQELSYVRAVPAPYLHITVLFLGEVPYNPILETTLQEIAANTLPLEMTFSKIEYGPPGREKRMVWAYLEGGEGFRKLVRDVMAGVTDAIPGSSFRSEALPHITLARFRKNAGNPELISLPPFKREKKSFSVSSMQLMESFLAASGAEYIPIETFSFTR